MKSVRVRKWADPLDIHLDGGWISINNLRNNGVSWSADGGPAHHRIIDLYMSIYGPVYERTCWLVQRGVLDDTKQKYSTGIFSHIIGISGMRKGTSASV